MKKNKVDDIKKYKKYKRKYLELQKQHGGWCLKKKCKIEEAVTKALETGIEKMFNLKLSKKYPLSSLKI